MGLMNGPLGRFLPRLARRALHTAGFLLPCRLFVNVSVAQRVNGQASPDDLRTRPNIRLHLEYLTSARSGRLNTVRGRRSASEVIGRAPENFMEPFVRRFVFDPLVPKQSQFEGGVA